MEMFIYFFAENFTVTLFVLGTFFALLFCFCKPRFRTRDVIIESFLAYFILFNIGISFLYNFVLHVFFGDQVAAFIGWAQSPFQAEVGFASLGYGVVGIIAFFWKNYGIRLAAILAPALFVWGAAGGHIYQIMTQHNVMPGNAGTILWTDIFIPVVGFTLLSLRWKYREAVTKGAII